MKFIFGAIIALFPVFAFSADSVVFSCTTENNKNLSITKKANVYQYEFGKKGKPELVFSNNINDVEIINPDSAYASINLASSWLLKNGDYEYEVYDSTNKSENHERDAGVIVYKKGKSITFVKCSNRYKIYSQ